jgi:predicted RNA-binding protein YlxR (DUF448 family)
MMAAEHETPLDPQRTCAGCKRAEARDALMRFVHGGEPGQWVPDIRRRLPGRGVSVHPTRRCVGLAVKQGRLRDAEVSNLIEGAAGQYRRRIEGLLSGAWRARKLAVGTDAVRESLQQRELRLLLVAADAAGSRQELEQLAERLGRHCLVFGDKALLGAVLGDRKSVV